MDSKSLSVILGSRLSTHHAKHFDSAVDGEMRIYDPLVALDPDCPADTGIHGRSIIEGRYALGLVSTGPTIGIAQDLSCDAASDVPGNLLALIKDDQQQAIDTAGDHALSQGKRIDDSEFVSLVKAEPTLRQSIVTSIDEASEVTPDRIDRAQKQVYFEADGDCILVTPVPSAKITAEATLRVVHPGKTSTEKPPRLFLPHGGANPQNVGYAVAKRSRTSVRGRIPMLSIRAPDPIKTEVEVLLARVLGSRSLTRWISFDDDDLKTFSIRSSLNISTAAARRAEEAHADEIAEAILEPVKALRERIARFETPLTTKKDGDGGSIENPDFDDFPVHEARILDPRLGEADCAALARRIADKASKRMSKVRAASSQDRKPVPAPTDDSMTVLQNAIEKALRTCS